MLRRIVLFSFVLFFYGVVFCVLGGYARFAWVNLRALHFSKTEGVIRECDKVYHEGTGLRYDLKLTYGYAVGGTNYVGHRAKYFEPDGWKYEEIRPVLAGFPAGATTVYFNPADPTDSVLLLRDPGEVLAIGGALIWFSAPILLSLVGVVNWVRYKVTKNLTVGIRIRQRPGKIEVYLPEASRVTFTIAGLWLGLTISGGIAMCFAQPEDWKLWALGVAAGTVVGGAAVLALRIRRDLAGLDSLVIDSNRKSVTLPQTFGRKSPLTLEIGPIDSVRIEPMYFHTKIGEICFSRLLICHLRNGELVEEKIAMWLEQEDRANAIADWLLVQLNKYG